MNTWRSNIPQFRTKLEQAIRTGLLKAAMHYQNKIKQALVGGYTSGEFVTGTAVNSVTMSPIRKTDMHDYIISVGTSLFYVIAWELGHYNLYTRKFERVEKWYPTFLYEKDTMKRFIQDELRGITL